jgi:putative MATE family efflux protein
VAIRLSDHFGYGKLLRFTVPTIGMMVFMSVYNVVDGFFVSNFAGKTPFAALNLIWPFLNILACVGFMFGTGGTAIVARLLGKGNPRKANQVFSLLVYAAMAAAVVLSIFGFIFVRRIAVLLGATPDMVDWCVRYARYLLAALPAMVLQFLFQPLMVAAEKPKLGFYVTFAAGMTNIVGDALLVGVFGLGLDGAAIATMLSQCLGGGIPLVFFLRRDNGTVLRIGRPTRQLKYLGETAVNGSSELLSNVSASIVSMAYNYQLMRYIGENGVAAYGTIAYLMFVFVAIFVGYSIGVSPVIGYNYGAENYPEQRNVFRKSLALIFAGSLLMAAASQILAGPLARLYVGYDPELEALTERAFRIFGMSFLLCGFNIFASAMFTALSNGVISAVISFFRTLVCETATVFILPALFGVDAIWFSIVVAEFIALLLASWFILRKRRLYVYL